MFSIKIRQWLVAFSLLSKNVNCCLSTAYKKGQKGKKEASEQKRKDKEKKNGIEENDKSREEEEEEEEHMEDEQDGENEGDEEDVENWGRGGRISALFSFLLFLVPKDCPVVCPFCRRGKKKTALDLDK